MPTIGLDKYNNVSTKMGKLIGNLTIMGQQIVAIIRKSNYKFPSYDYYKQIPLIFGYWDFIIGLLR